MGFDDIQLTGAPAVSANCWNELEREIAAAGCRSFLEWGSGNSTIRILSRKRDNILPELTAVTSVENDAPFYLRMLEEFRRVLGEIAGAGDLTVTHRVFQNRVDSRTWARRKELEAPSVRYQQAMGGFKDPRSTFQTFSSRGGLPRFYIRLAMSTIRMAARDASFFSRWLGDTVLRRRSQIAAWQEGYPTGAATGQCIHTRFETGDFTLDYLLVPKLFRSAKILDGLYAEYATYVNAPVSSEYDSIFVDGRSRVSCMKRVLLDGLLSGSGTLFVHDAYGFHMNEGFSLFPGGVYLNGNAVLIDGSDFSNAFPYSLVEAGEAVDTTEPVNLREMFVYKRASGSEAQVQSKVLAGERDEA